MPLASLSPDMPFNRKARTRLSEQFADIYQTTQEDYRRLLSSLRDEHVDMREFSSMVEQLSDRLIKLKRIHEQLVSERDELRREQEEMRARSEEDRAGRSGMSEPSEPSIRKSDERPPQRDQVPRESDSIRPEGGQPMAS